MKKIQNLFLPTPTTLLSPLADVLMSGGLSIILFFVLSYFVPKDANIFSWSIAVYYAAFLVNYPHFASSYQLVYGDARKSFFHFQDNRFFALKLWWAGVIVPVVLIGYFYYALSSGGATAMGYLASAMYFFVGWHYVKQIYGCTIVFSSAKRVFYSMYERWSILFPLYALWAVSFVYSNLYTGTRMYFDIPYTSIGFPGWLVNALYGILAVATLGMLLMFAMKYWRERVVPPLSALVALCSIYLWYLPTFSHPFFFYIIPFFHSTQYLLFVLAYKRNSVTITGGENISQVNEQENKQGTLLALTYTGLALFLVVPTLVIVAILWSNFSLTLETLFAQYSQGFPTLSAPMIGTTLIFIAILFLLQSQFSSFARKTVIGKFIYFFFGSYALGLFMFAIIPLSLDLFSRFALLPAPFSYNSLVFGTSLYVFFITIFINVHHYFIDNVIWKRDNSYIR
jgi:hypothetical protein